MFEKVLEELKKKDRSELSKEELEQLDFLISIHEDITEKK